VRKVFHPDKLGLEFEIWFGLVNPPTDVLRGWVMSSAGDFEGWGCVFKEMIFLLTFVSAVP